VAADYGKIERKPELSGTFNLDSPNQAFSFQNQLVE
jgi:hypothetical protein